MAGMGMRVGLAEGVGVADKEMLAVLEGEVP